MPRKVEVDRDVLIWLHKQPRNVFLTVLGAMLGLAKRFDCRNGVRTKSPTEIWCRNRYNCPVQLPRTNAVAIGRVTGDYPVPAGPARGGTRHGR